MGTTIGINSMILFASLYFIAEQNSFSMSTQQVKYGFWIINGSLLLFWLSLMGAGIVKAIEKEKDTAFQLLMQKLSTWFNAFAGAGLGIFIGVLLISYPILKNIFRKKLST